jgi:hypothetical protein
MFIFYKYSLTQHKNTAIIYEPFRTQQHVEPNWPEVEAGLGYNIPPPQVPSILIYNFSHKKLFMPITDNSYFYAAIF